MLGSFWTFANILSISRVPLAVIVAIIVLTDGPVGWGLSLILVAALTDFLDGLVARRTDTISGWGKILDPAADKVSIAILGIALVWKELLPFWFLWIILLRDILILTGGTFLTRRLGHIHMSNLVGKTATTAIAITFMLGLLRADEVVQTISLGVTAGLLGLSLLVYAVRLKDLRHSPA